MTRDIKLGVILGLLTMAIMVMLLEARARTRRRGIIAEALRSAAKPAKVNPPAKRASIAVEPGGEVERYLDELALLDHQSGAVSVDVGLFLGWAKDDQAGLLAACGTATQALRGMGAAARALPTPGTCDEVKQRFLAFLAALTDAYAEIGSRKDPDRATPLVKAQTLYNAYRRELKRFTRPALPDADGPQPEPTLAHPADLDAYRRAKDRMAAGEYAKAYALLVALKAKYPHNAFVLVQMSDCVARAGMGEGVLKGVDAPEEQAIALLDAVVASRQYSPLLAEAFLKWRTLYQSHHHGASNYSHIPNGEYNARRKALVSLLRTHLASHPADDWARRQKRVLLDLPNIQRGGAMGNSNLTYWGLLYAGDLIEKLVRVPADDSRQDRPRAK